MLNSKRAVVVVATLLLILFVALPQAVAQTDRGTITGTVVDPTGAVIVGAKVTAIHTGTKVATETATTTSGKYTIPGLRSGMYDVIVEQPGFKKAVLSGMEIQVGQTVRADASLQLGETSQAVEVTAETIQVERDTSDRGTVVTSREIQALPLITQGEQRNPALFITLVPGVTGRGTIKSTPSALQGSRTANTTVNGSQSGSLEFHLDGSVIGSSTNFSSAFNNLPFPVDAVGEFKVITLNPPAEFGRTGQGITTFNLKSGSNELHGSVFEYFRNEVLDANGFFANLAPPDPKTGKAPRGKNRQNEFGFTAGGPILKDKTFFFGWYQGFRLRRGVNNSLDTVPTQAMRGGNLSNVLGSQISTCGANKDQPCSDALGRPVYSGQAYDPATQPTVAAGAIDPGTGLRNTSSSSAILRDGFGFNPVTGLPIPGQANVIPSNRIDPVAKAIFDLFPNPTLPGQGFGYQNNWLSNILSVNDTNQGGGKIDHVFSSNNRISGEFIYSRNYNPTGSKWPGAISEGSTNTIGNRIARFSHDWVMRPNLVNHWTLGFNRTRIDSFPETGLGWPAKIGYKGVPQTGAGTTFIQMDIGGLGNTYGRGGQGYSAENVFTFDEGLSWIKGKHTIKMGFNYVKMQYNSLSSGHQSSYLTFLPAATSLPGPWFNAGCAPGAACPGVGTASFLLGLVDHGDASIITAVGANRIGQYAGYVQDDFKATSKLTLNLGLRYDLLLPTVDAHNRMSWLDPNATNPDLGGIKGAMVFASDSRRAPVEAFKKAFGPRFGFAYSIGEKTVIRGGYGILYTAGGAQRSNGLQFVQGFNSSNAVLQDQSTGSPGLLAAIAPQCPGLRMTLRDGWPAQCFNAPPFVSPSLGVGQGLSAAFGRGLPPQIQSWNLTIQRELPGQILLDVAYVGTKGTHLASRLNPTSQVPSKYLSLGELLFRNIADPAVQALPVVQAMPIDPATGNHSPFRATNPSQKGFEGTWGGGATLAQALRPFPQWSQDTVQGTYQMRDWVESDGNSSYHALQVQARKRLSENLNFLASYTWSKTLTDAESIYNEFSGFVQDTYDRKAEKALSLNDYPHNLVLSYQYDFPFLRNAGGVAGKVLGGWSIAGIQQYQSGGPQMIVTGSNQLNPYFGPNSFLMRPNVVPGVNKKSDAILNGTWDPNGVGDAGMIYNAKAWTDPQVANKFSFGNGPRTYGDVRRFAYLSEDLSVIKRTNINERVNVELRADFLNIFNRTIFGFDAGGDQYGQILGGNAMAFGFGRVSAQNNFPREVQFGLKINY